MIAVDLRLTNCLVAVSLLCRATADPDVAAGQSADDRYGQSVELSWEELRHVIQQFGFSFEREADRDCTYTRAQHSMLWSVYRTKFFTARKPEASAAAASSS
mgnify:CR=1 FL=1